MLKYMPKNKVNHFQRLTILKSQHWFNNSFKNRNKHDHIIHFINFLIPKPIKTVKTTPPTIVTDNGIG